MDVASPCVRTLSSSMPSVVDLHFQPLVMFSQLHTSHPHEHETVK